MFGQNIKRKNLLYGIFFAACLIFAMRTVGLADVAEAEQAAALYCDMVKAGAWPASVESRCIIYLPSSRNGLIQSARGDGALPPSHRQTVRLTL